MGITTTELNEWNRPHFCLQTSVLCQTALRAKMPDDRVRDFIERPPDAVVVDLGAGLDGARRGTPTRPTLAFGACVPRG